MKKKQSYYVAFAACCLAALMAITYQLNAFNYFRNLTTFSLFGKAPSKVTEVANTSDNAIQIALLLDTSNSMDGLIEQTKSQLWKIVSELSNADKDGVTPNLQIALYEYGNDGLAARTGHIRMVTPFTSDMDLVSEKLFALTTNGGSEYCGQVIATSLKDLNWTNSEDGLRMIYIAGNEGFNQGPILYSTACLEAQKRGISVNTIFCGPQRTGINLGWELGAELADGSFASIDHNQVTTYTPTPYDAQIEKLNQDLNTTYVPYGERGLEYLGNMTIQDVNASSYSQSNVADRAAFKSSTLYKNEKWDFVDAYEKDKKILKEKSKLPSKYKGKTEAEIETEIKKAKAKRDQIKTQIQELSKKRKQHIQANEVSTDSSNLEKSMLKSIEKEAAKKGYKIKN